MCQPTFPPTSSPSPMVRSISKRICSTRMFDPPSTWVFCDGNFGPGISVGLSVSRVGGSAQVKAMRSVAGSLRLNLAQYRELEAFSAFGSDLAKASKAQLARGARLVELLKQPQYAPFPVERQVVSIWAGTNGQLDDIEVSDI